MRFDVVAPPTASRFQARGFLVWTTITETKLLRVDVWHLTADGAERLAASETRPDLAATPARAKASWRCPTPRSRRRCDPSSVRRSESICAANGTLRHSFDRSAESGATGRETPPRWTRGIDRQERPPLGRAPRRTMALPVDPNRSEAHAGRYGSRNQGKHVPRGRRSALGRPRSAVRSARTRPCAGLSSSGQRSPRCSGKSRPRFPSPTPSH